MPTGNPGVQRAARMGRPSELSRVRSVRTVKDDDGQARQVDVTMLDQLLESLRMSGVVQHACARAGVATRSFYDWTRTGARARRKQLLGEELDERDQECLDFLLATEVAEAEGKLLLLAPAHALARGGQQIVTTTVRHYRRADGVEVTETTTRTEHARPDGAMIRWLLSKRFPGEFADRLELTGADGGPVRVEHGDADVKGDPAQELVEDLRRYLEACDAEAAEERRRKRRAKTTTSREVTAGD